MSLPSASCRPFLFWRRVLYDAWSVVVDGKVGCDHGFQRGAFRSYHLRKMLIWETGCVLDQRSTVRHLRPLVFTVLLNLSTVSPSPCPQTHPHFVLHASSKSLTFAHPTSRRVWIDANASSIFNAHCILLPRPV